MTNLNHHNNKKLLVLFITSILFLESCNKDNPSDHLQKGVDYFNKGEYEKAVLELKTASQSDKNTAETYYYLALLDEKNRQYKAMAENLKKTIELSPSHNSARSKLGKVLLLLGQPDEALAQAETILKASNQDADALLLKSAVLIRQKKYAEAQSIVTGVLAANPNSTDALMLNASIYTEMEKFNDAFTAINTAIKLDPQNISLRLFKIQLDAKTNNIDAVITDYNELVTLYPDKQEFKINLARIYAQTGKKKEAEELLQGLITAKPDDISLKLFLLDFLAATSPENVQNQLRQYSEQYRDKPKILLTLASWMMNRKNFDEAQNTLNRVIELDESTEQVLSAKMLLAKIAFDLNDLDTSEKIVRDILAANSNYIDAKAMLARLLLVKKQYDDAIDLLSKMLWEKPDSEETLVLLAQAYTIKGDHKQAEKQFIRVLEVNPANLQALTYIYDKALSTKDFDYAQEIIKNALNIDPNNLLLLEKLVRLDLLTNQWAAAEESAQRIANVNNPQAPNLAKIFRAQIFQGQGEYAKAIELYKEVIADIPENYELLVDMAHCYESINKRHDMIVFLNDLLAKDAQNIAAAIVLSDLLIIEKQFDKSISLLSNLINGNNKIPKLYASLAKVKLAQTDNQAAIAIYRDGLQQNPGDVMLSLSLATLYEIVGDYDSAISIYETLLKNNPNLDIAINNLASIFSEKFTSEEKLKTAIQMTEKFKDSTQPYYKDTYAWAIIKQGDANTGVNLLNQIITLAPDVPIFRYHLGVANHKNGNDAAAIAELKQALELANKKGGFADKQAAETLLSELVTKK